MTYKDTKFEKSPSPDYKHDRTTIVIPCYNEVNRLHLEMFLNFARKHPNISFVFIDDGSIDLTINLLCGAMAALPKQIDVLMMKASSIHGWTCASVCNDLGISATISALSGASPMVMACATSSMVISPISLASSEAANLLFQESLNYSDRCSNNSFNSKKSGFRNLWVHDS